MKIGWAVFLPAVGWRLRSSRGKTVAGLVKEMVAAARRRGFVTIFDDEVMG